MRNWLLPGTAAKLRRDVSPESSQLVLSENALGDISTPID
jgi:hypothetical protein